jgi:cell volume regulation protein A
VINLNTENIILIASVLLIASIIASKTSFKLGIPTLIFFLAIGMISGSEGIGGIYFDNPKIAQILGIIALNFILFSGGMDTKLETVKPVLRRGISLSTIGVLVTAATLGLIVHWLTDFTLIEGLLLGSIVSSTDAAAVFSILRSKKTALKGWLRPTLELESGSNDPLAYVLTISFTFLIANGNATVTQLILMFIQQMAIGAALGYVLGRGMVMAVNNAKLEIEGLYPVLVIAMMLFTYGFTDLLNGNGFLAVYLAALVLGNSNFLHKKSLMKFYDGMAWLMQIVMFLTLGLLVFPSHIVPVIDTGLLIAAALMFVARPIGVFISLVFFKMKKRDKLFISWVGLRGAVPIVFATYPMIAGIEKADMIFNLVFFISVTSVLLQGYTFPLVAKWLKVSVPEKIKRRTELDFELYDSARTELVEIVLPGNSPVVGKPIVNLKLPKSVMIVLLERDDKYIQPGGSTVLEEGDKLLLLANSKEALNTVYNVLQV